MRQVASASDERVKRMELEMFRNVLGTIIETRYNKEMLVKTKFLAKKVFMALDFVKLITKSGLDMKCSLLIVFT